MTSWHSYPKVYNLGHHALDDLLSDPVLVEEKIDGSQFSFGLFDGVLRVRSKGQIIKSPEAAPAMFQEAVTLVASLPLHDAWTYRGEVLTKPKHNVLAYDRVPRGGVIIFDINIAEEAYLPYEQKHAEAERLGLETVPLLYVGMLSDMDVFRALLDTPSILGGQKVEGVVIKNYARFGIDGHALMGKHVSESFKEIHRGEWRRDNPAQVDILTELVVAYRTPARWQKAVQHLAEAGLLLGEPKDIGPLIRETIRDISEECTDEIKERLFKWAWKRIGHAIAAGLPEWYKGQLLARQFGENTDDQAQAG